MFCRKCGMNNVDGARFCAGCGSEMYMPKKENVAVAKKKNGNKTILFIVLALVLITAVIVSILFAVQKKKEKDYETQIDQGEHYLENLEYEKAEDFYLAAIKINPKEEEPYLCLARIYSAQNKPEKAKDILEQGLEATESEKIQEQYSLYSYVDDVLIPELGQADTGIYEWSFPPKYASWEADPINNVSGVITSRIMDFDEDGEDELLVAILKNDVTTDDFWEPHNAVYLEIYENEGGDVERTAEWLACDGVFGGRCEEVSGVFLKEHEGRIYICGGDYSAPLYEDGTSFTSFVIVYEEETFRKYTGTSRRIQIRDYYDYHDEAEDMAELLEEIDLPKAASVVSNTFVMKMSYQDDMIDKLFNIESEYAGYSFDREDGGVSIIHFWTGSEEADIVSELPEAEALEILNKYGYSENDEAEYFSGVEGSSKLLFSTSDSRVEDMGDYYLVDAKFLEQIKVPADIKAGERITVVVNELTGEEETWTCTENGEYGPTFGTVDYPDLYYTGGRPDEDGMLPVYQASADAVCKLVYEGELAIMKNAREEIAISQVEYLVNKEVLRNGYWNCVYFNEKGYAYKLVYYGD